MTLRQSGWFGKEKKRAAQSEAVVEVVAEGDVFVVIWPKRCCPKCGSERIRCYGKSQDKVRRYHRCAACGGKFLSEER